MEVFLLTQQRAKGVDDVKGITALYARKLTEYPADIARRALTEWPTDSTFWPAWHELAEAMEYFYVRRKGMLEALENAVVSDE